MIDPHHRWHVIYNARSNSQHPPTSPNTAPATQNESHDWSASHMKRHLHCAEQQASPSNFTKFCACHAKWISWLIHITYEAVIYNARSNSQHPPTSPNTALATQNESHDWSASHMKRHLQCAEQQSTPSNLTKYCACHAKWISWLIHITYETSFTMCGATGITFQPHQILRLPRKMTTQHLTEIGWKQVKRHFQCATDPRMIRERSENDPTLKTQNWTRCAAKGTFRARQEQVLLKITTFPAPAIIPNFTTCCTCHKKWHMNFTKRCTCREKWHMNFTKCCTCHEK